MHECAVCSTAPLHDRIRELKAERDAVIAEARRMTVIEKGLAEDMRRCCVAEEEKTARAINERDALRAALGRLHREASDVLVIRAISATHGLASALAEAAKLTEK